MFPEDVVLIAIVNNARDFAIARDAGWYRVPAARAPDGIHAQYLALYQTKSFGDDAFAINYYARINGVELVTRRDLFPDEPDHPHAPTPYYKLSLGPLVRLPHPIISRKWRRITFLVTTGERFQKAWELNDLVLGTPDDEVVWRAIRDMGNEQNEARESSAVYQVDTEAAHTLKDRARHMVEIDQSIKVEQTNEDTIIAMANGIQAAIRIPAKVKREMIAILRKRNKTGKQFSLWLFAAGVYLLIRDRLDQIDMLVIDREYMGHEDSIKAMLARWCWQNTRTRTIPIISFSQIGKHSPAHALAWGAHHKQKIANLSATTLQFVALLRDKNK